MKKHTLILLVVWAIASSAHSATLMYHWKLDDLPQWESMTPLDRTPLYNSATGAFDAFLRTNPSDRDLIQFQQPGSVGAAIEFGGTSTYAELGHISPGADPFTFALWIKRLGHSEPQFQALFGSVGGQSGQWGFQLIDFGTTLRWYSGTSGQNISIPDSDVWYHVAITRDSAGDFKMYLNGLVQQTGTRTEELTNSSGGVWLGRYASGSGPFQGLMDDVRVYDDALSAEEIVGVMESRLFAWNPTPANGSVGSGYSPDDLTVTVDLSWHTAMDMENPDQINPDVAMHYLYVSDDLNVSNDTQFHLIDQVPVDGLTASSIVSELNFNGRYMWRVDQGLKDGQGNGLMPDDPATIKGTIWTFQTVQAVSPPIQGPPGIVVDYSPHDSNLYLGSPGIAIIGDGVYLAKSDEYGSGSTLNTTRVYRSDDAGNSWSRIATLEGMFWASIFVHDHSVYLFGTDKLYGNTVIMKSEDQGQTWTTPECENTGILLSGRYHTAPVPMVVHDGRIWRAMEDREGPGGWGTHFRAFMMSAAQDADILKASNWTISNRTQYNSSWLKNRFRGFLEGNAVVSPKGEILNILRVDLRFSDWEYDTWGKAAIIRHSADGHTASFDPQEDFVEFPGGLVKFTIRKDPHTDYYWALTTAVPPMHRDAKPISDRIRNTVALIRSNDLKSWEVRCIVLYEPDSLQYGFQYLDWEFEGNDMIAVSRTSYPDGTEGNFGIDRAHDANFLTFHRLENFRELTMNDSVYTGDSFCAYRPIADLTGNCSVGFDDLFFFLSAWLDCGFYPDCRN